MLSFEQRERIRVGIPATFTVDGANFTASKFYANQYVREVYPAITLDYSVLDSQWKGPLNGLIAASATTMDVIYDQGYDVVDVLTIDVYTADGQVQGKNSIRVVDYIVEEVYKWFQIDFDEPDICVVGLSPIRSMDEDQGSYFRRRRNFDVMLRHVVKKTKVVERIKEVDYSVEVS